MTDLERKRMQALDAQIALQLNHAQTEFWKVGIAVAVTSAIGGGTIVQILDLLAKWPRTISGPLVTPSASAPRVSHV